MKKGWPWGRVLQEQRELWEKPLEEVVHFAAQLQGAKRVLDLGCGAGRHTVYLARAGVEVHASDIAVDGLEETLCRLRPEGLHAAVLRSDMISIPYQDTVFEAASLSKQVFAFAVLRLVDGGVIELDRPLRDYLGQAYEEDPRIALSPHGTC